MKEHIETLRMDESSDSSNSAINSFFRDSFDEIFSVEESTGVEGTVKDIHLRRNVHLQTSSDLNELEPFLEMVQINAILEHPNILPVYDVAVIDDRLHAVYRSVSGTVLSEWLKNPPQPVIGLNRVMSIWENLCQAVSFVHGKSVAHAAISCDKVLIGKFNDVFLTGWDNATDLRPVDEDQRMELLKKDQESLGAILKALIVSERVQCRVNGLTAIADKAASSTPYESVASMIDDLHRFRDGYPTVAEDAPLWRHFLMFADRHRTTIGFATCMLIITLVSGVLYAKALTRQTRELEGVNSVLEDSRKVATATALAAENKLGERKSMAPAFVDLARAMIEKGDYRRADKLLTQAQALDPKLSESIEVRGDLHQGKFELEQAIASYRRALGYTSDNAFVKLALSVTNTMLALTQKGEVAEAKTKLTRFLLENGRGFEALRIAHDFKCPRDLYRQVCQDVLARLSKGIQYLDRNGVRKIAVQGGGVDAREALKTLRDLEIDELDPLVLVNADNMPGLEEVVPFVKSSIVLNFSQVIDISPLRNLPLKNIYLCKGDMLDLTALSGKSIDELEISQCVRIFDLEPLRGAPLTHLSANHTKIDDLEPIEGAFEKFINHRGISLRGVPVFDLRPLKGMVMKDLFLDDTQVRDISALVDVEMTELWLSGTKVRDLSSLAKQKKLRKLMLMNCPNVVDLSPLKNVKSLRMLRIENTGVRDLSPLKGLELDAVGLTPKRITTGWSALKNMPTLKRITTKAQNWNEAYRGTPWQKPHDFWKDHGAE